MGTHKCAFLLLLIVFDQSLAQPTKTASGAASQQRTRSVSTRPRSFFSTPTPSLPDTASPTSGTSSSPSSSPTLTPTPPPLPSIAPPPDATASASLPPFLSPTPSSLPTPSPSSTTSASPGPLTCGASPAGCAFAILPLPMASTTQALVFSLVSSRALDCSVNAPPPPPPPFSSATLRLSLPVPPSRNEALTLSCAPSNVTFFSLALTPALAPPYSFVATGPSSLSFSGVSATAWTGALNFALTLNLTLAAITVTTPTPALVTCTISSTLMAPGADGVDRVFPRYSPVSTISVSATLLPVSLPLAYDVLLELAPGLFRSSWGGAPVLLPLLSGNDSTLVNATSPGRSSWLSSALVLNSSSSLLALARVAQPPPPASTMAPAWSLTLSGSSHLVIVARPALLGTVPSFSSSTTVFVNGVPAITNWLSASSDPMLLSVITPNLTLVCGADIAASGDVCGVRTLTLGTSFGKQAGALTDFAQQLAMAPMGSASSAPPLGLLPSPLQLACPPACPGDWPALLSGSAPSVLAMIVAAQAVAASPTATVPPQDEGGLFFITRCVGAYTDPATGSCSNASDPLATQCAWGAGDTCQLCPPGALCPGGNRLWPRPGWWLPSQDATPAALVVCVGADATVRCPGASASGVAAGAFPCGSGYRTGTVGCAGCAPAFYPTADGLCALCPSSDFASGVIVPVTYIVVAALCLCLIFTFAVFAIVRKQGGTLMGSLLRTVQLVIWMWTALQVLVQVGRSTQTLALPALTGFYTGLQVLQFSGVTLNPACLSSGPFTSISAQFAAAAALLSIVLLYGLATALCSLFRRRRMRALQGKPAAANTLVVSPLHAAAVTAPPEADMEAPKKVIPFPFSYVCSCLRSTLRSATGIALQVLVSLYAMFTNSALSMLTCANYATTVRGYLKLNSDGTALLASARSGALLAGAATTSLPLTTDAVAALLAPNGLVQLVGFASGTLPRTSLGATLGASTASLLAAPITVPVLASNPYAVCFEAGHASIYSAAWAVLVVISLSFPLASFLYVRMLLDARMSSPAIVGKEKAARWVEVRAAWGLAAWHTRPAPHDDVLSSNPAPPPKKGVPTVTAAHALIDKTEEATSTPLLVAWTAAGTLPSRYSFVQLQQCVLLVLAIPVAYNVQASGIGGRSFSALLLTQAGGLTASLVVTLGAAVLLYRSRPYPQMHAWKTGAGAYLLLIAALSATLNFSLWYEGAGVLGLTSSSSQLHTLNVALSVLILLCAALLFVLLLILFFSTLISEGRAEGVAIITRASAAAERTTSHIKLLLVPLDESGSGSADESASSSLSSSASSMTPVTWERIDDPSHPYFRHTSSQETTWTDPTVWERVAAEGDAPEYWRHRDTGEAQWTHPSPWLSVTSSSGDSFFRSLVTDEVSWTDPSVPAVAAAVAAAAEDDKPPHWEHVDDRPSSALGNEVISTPMSIYNRKLGAVEAKAAAARASSLAVKFLRTFSSHKRQFSEYDAALLVQSAWRSRRAARLSKHHKVRAMYESRTFR